MFEMMVMVVLVSLLVVALGISDRRRSGAVPRVEPGDRDAARIRADLRWWGA